MELVAALSAFLADPGYALPLALAVGAAIVAIGWAYLRRAAPSPPPPTLGRVWWDRRSLTLAYLSLQQGRYFLALYILWGRLATIAWQRFHVRIDLARAPDPAGISRLLSSTLTLRRLVEDMTQAYHSTFWAEHPSWLEQQWSWLRRRQQRRAARDFASAIRDLAEALPALEVG